MDQRPDVDDRAVTATAKAEWTRPEVDRMVAGIAEGSSDISTDGVDIPS